MANSRKGSTSSETSAFASWPVRLVLLVLCASFAICLLLGVRAAITRRENNAVSLRASQLAAQTTQAGLPGPGLAENSPPSDPLETLLPVSSVMPQATIQVSPTPNRPPVGLAFQSSRMTATPPSGVIPGSPRTYTVQPGDSLPQIAAALHAEPLALMQANHIANPLSITVGQVLIVPPASSETRRVVVDLSEQRLYGYESDSLVFNFVVSTGQNDGTLRGSFHVLDKVDKAYSAMWGFWMPNWIGIYYATDTVENGIHALPLDKNGQRLWADSLGQPISAGCVLLSPEDAQTLYDWVVIGTPVLIRE